MDVVQLLVRVKVKTFGLLKCTAAALSLNNDLNRLRAAGSDPVKPFKLILLTLEESRESGSLINVLDSELKMNRTLINMQIYHKHHIKMKD